MYTIPIIPPDLRHEESIIQAALALDSLQNTINSVFERIDARIARNHEHVGKLEQRIVKAQTKIQGLVGTKKAIKIYSPARFPAAHVFHDIPLTFVPDMKNMLSEEQDENKKTPLYEVNSRVEPLSSAAHKEKINFCPSMLPSTKTPGVRPTLVEAKDSVNRQSGLGLMPEQLKSVNSLLLVNTTQRMYSIENNEDLNSWKRTKFLRHKRQTPATQKTPDQTQLMEPAPFSLANKQLSQKRPHAGSIFYTPRLHEAPDLDLPLDLPDLPGIANDIHFERQAQQQIAPSFFIDNLPELPELKATVENPSQLNAATSAPTIVVPPPPPPPVVAPAAVIGSTEIKTAQFSPPPPPPPPPAAPVISAAIVAPDATLTSASKTKTPAAALPVADARSDLMDAIRKAGGTGGGRLRAAAAIVADVHESATTSTLNSSKNRPAAPMSSGGDLMADLRNKLGSRRQGISGTKEGPKAAKPPTLGSDPVLNRLSALIPPPPVGRRSRNMQNTDDEDDDDDSNETDWVD